MTGLMFPDDLDRWRRWHDSRNPLRRLRSLLRPAPPPTGWLGVRGEQPVVLAAIDATTPTQLASVVRPVSLLAPDVPIAVVAPQPLDAALLPGDWQWSRIDGTARPAVVADIRALVSVGHYLPLAGLADRWASEVGADRLVVQHGLLTPFAPPLPRVAHLLAFSAADAGYVAAGRPDVRSTVVGSQLLWSAGLDQHGPGDDRLDRWTGVAPVYLGQLHGVELARSAKIRAVEAFWRANPGMSYRPHPAERDRLSRWQHGRWERRGLEFDRSGLSLPDLGRPVVSIFSTGVLESAARGLPAWVDHDRPPAWLGEFWERYRLSRWGTDPTPPPERPETEPARAIADQIRTSMESRP